MSSLTRTPTLLAQPASRRGLARRAVLSRTRQAGRVSDTGEASAYTHRTPIAEKRQRRHPTSLAQTAGTPLHPSSCLCRCRAGTYNPKGGAQVVPRRGRGRRRQRPGALVALAVCLCQNASTRCRWSQLIHISTAFGRTSHSFQVVNAHLHSLGIPGTQGCCFAALRSKSVEPEQRLRCRPAKLEKCGATWQCSAGVAALRAAGGSKP